MTDREIDRLTRADRDLIAAIVPEGSRVLDLGCGDGGLLTELIEQKGVIGRGIDIDESNLVRCIGRGLTVAMSDIDKGLVDYPPQSYDYVILNQTLQIIRQPEMVIREMLRVGRHAIVGFPNFGHWRLRWSLLSQGKMPKSSSLPFEWYDTPNIHQLTIEDFRAFCKNRGILIIREEYFMFGKWRHSALINPLANLFAVTGMFVLGGNR
jgi:methionine biosynthesis protein MetW